MGFNSGFACCWVNIRIGVLKAGIKVETSNYIPQYLWDVINSLCHGYLLLAYKSSYLLHTICLSYCSVWINHVISALNLLNVFLMWLKGLILHSQWAESGHIYCTYGTVLKLSLYKNICQFWRIFHFDSRRHMVSSHKHIHIWCLER